MKHFVNLLPCLIPPAAVQTVVILQPRGDRNGGVLILGVADNHGGDPGVDDLPLAHGAGIGVGNQLSGGILPPYQIQSGPDHVVAGGGDNSVCLRMDAAAELIPLPPGDF